MRIFSKKTIFAVSALLFIGFEVFAGKYTGEVWDNNSSMYKKIFNMPFNKELMDGTLNEQVFKSYIIQDYFFLQNYRKVFGILLAKAPDQKATELVSNLIKCVDEEIQDIHSVYFKKLNITKEVLNNSVCSPATEFYNSFLIKTAVLEPFEVGLIATLPCHWIYYQIGIDMKKNKICEDNKYREWIDGYGETSWEKSETKIFVDMIENYMQNTTAENRRKMEQAFKTAVKLEYMFWDGAYRKVNWIE